MTIPCGGSPKVYCGQLGDKGKEFELWEDVRQRVEDVQKKVPEFIKYPIEQQCKDISRGFLVEGVVKKPKHLLLVATDRITGIECPSLWQDVTPHYWAFAWEVAQRYSVSPGELIKSRIGMAMNAKWNLQKHGMRDYAQLHIHVSCIDKDVQKYLDGNDQVIQLPPNWNTLTIKDVNGQFNKYRVLRLGADTDLAQYNLFKLVYDYLYNEYKQDKQKAEENMQYQTLVVAKRQNGFYILNSDTSSSSMTQQQPYGTGHGENLLNENY